VSLEHRVELLSRIMTPVFLAQCRGRIPGRRRYTARRTRYGATHRPDEPMEEIQQTQDLAAHLAVEYGPRVLSAALILIAGFAIARWTGRLATRGLGRLTLEPSVRDLLLRLVRLLVLLLFLIMALQNLGIELLPLIAGLGIAGAGIALALQGVLGNLAAGLTIIFTRPFRVGEYISIAGEEGEVRTISLFSTTLRHADLSLVVIPNRKIAGEILHNYGVIRQLNVRVALARAADLDTAVAVARVVLSANPRVLTDPAAILQPASIGEWSVTLAVRPWVAVIDYEPAIGEINAELARSLGARGVQLQSAAAAPRLDGRTEQPQ
jgi:small conductance mechanosensitive channel